MSEVRSSDLQNSQHQDSTGPVQSPTTISTSPKIVLADDPLVDWFGIAASLGCAIHCAALPFVIAFLPALGLNFLADNTFHKVMVLICLLFAIASFIPGWNRHHRLLPLVIAIIGLVLIGTEAFVIKDDCCTEPTAQKEDLVISGTAHTSVLGSPDFIKKAYMEVDCEILTLELTSNTSLIPSGDRTIQAANLFVRWIAPLGGILLIIAHLANRIISNHCNCKSHMKMS